ERFVEMPIGRSQLRLDEKGRLVMKLLGRRSTRDQHGRSRQEKQVLHFVHRSTRIAPGKVPHFHRRNCLSSPFHATSHSLTPKCVKSKRPRKSTEQKCVSLERIEITPFAVIAGDILQNRRSGSLTVIRSSQRNVLFWSQGELVLIIP